MSLKADRQRKAFYKKAKKGFQGYPVATIAYYGPTDETATKVVVSIFTDAALETGPIQKWFSDQEIRNDTRIFAEILQFLTDHHVKSIAMVDRIIGCPHEGGIDYPEGEACPACPFWKGRNRWTGELVH